MGVVEVALTYVLHLLRKSSKSYSPLSEMTVFLTAIPVKTGDYPRTPSRQEVKLIEKVLKQGFLTFLHLLLHPLGEPSIVDDI